ncbi:MAG: hypothetical protein ACTIDN_06275 [Acetobacter sp.]|uniref:hypothetical protein n=1 Tax=Acetobacter sp. TaxID=440 RepID=UPI003F93D0CC
MSGKRSAFKLVAALAFSGCVAVLGNAGAAMAQTPFHGPVLKVPAVSPPMTAVNVAPGVLDYDGIPTVEHASPANVAGLMAYCYEHKLVKDTTVRSLGRKLAARDGVSTDPAYAWGGVGRLMLDHNAMFDITTLKPNLQSAVCSRSALRGPDLLKSR